MCPLIGLKMNYGRMITNSKMTRPAGGKPGQQGANDRSRFIYRHVSE